MQKIKAVVARNITSYASWFPGVYKIVNSVEEADVLFLPGGADVHPSLYEHRNIASYASLSTDIEELDYLDRAIKRAIPIVGICRGLQLINVYLGGKMVQDMNTHSGSHEINVGSKIMRVNSLHHQLVYPYTISKDSYRILGSKPKHASGRYLFDGQLCPEFEDIEIMHFPSIRAIGFQYHPEMMKGSEFYREGTDYSIGLVNDLIESKL